MQFTKLGLEESKYTPPPLLLHELFVKVTFVKLGLELTQNIPPPVPVGAELFDMVTFVKVGLE